MTRPEIQSFVDHFADIVDDREAFAASLLREPRKSFRVNTIKSSREAVVGRLSEAGVRTETVPWYQDAVIVHDDVLSGTLERFLGTFHIQELASMLPPLVAADELRRARMVLDACAAPGSKTTQAAAIMGNRGCLIANDRSYSRIRALQFNIHKQGVVNALITNYELQQFPARDFDVILLDAPCTSIGTVRKSPNLFGSWSIGQSHGYGGLQKDLLVRSFDMLAPGGTLVYSTCSLAPEENEIVIDHLLRHRPARVKPVSLPGFRFGEPVQRWDGRELHPGVAGAGRVWPHHNDTDGFFVAKVTR